MGGSEAPPCAPYAPDMLRESVGHAWGLILPFLMGVGFVSALLSVACMVECFRRGQYTRRFSVVARLGIVAEGVVDALLLRDDGGGARGAAGAGGRAAGRHARVPG